MYRIIKDKKDVIQDTINHVVIDPTLKEKLNGVSSLTYSIPFNDKYYNDYKELETIVEVYGENENYPEFIGRLMSKNKTFDGNIQLTFEGELAYLNDIQYPPYIYKGSVEGFFSDILNYYNQHCTPSRVIHKGIVTVEDKNDYITRESQDNNSCWKVINEKLIKSLGGYLKLRYVNGERYLDYLLESGVVSNQKVEFGKNLLDLEEYIDATQVATVIIPLGKRDEQTKERVTIESVNDGKNYIESSLVNRYGRIEKTVVWDDVTIPNNLFTKANKSLGNIILANKQIKVKTVDLHFTDAQIDSLKIGDIINCISAPHNLNVQMILFDRERKLNSPVNDTISLGTEAKTLTNELSDTISNVTETDSKIKGNWLQNVIDDATKMMLGGSGGYVYIHQSENGHPDAIYIMDSDSTSEAKNIILLNKNGIGFSNNGINGPYTSAWTIDGKFNTSYVHVDDLFSFSGKIGGFNITEKSIYSGDKSSVDSKNTGIYQDKDGQFSLGNENSSIRFYKEDNNQWQLEIAANSIVIGSQSIEEKIEEIELKPTIKINSLYGIQQVYSPSTDTYIPDWSTQPLTLTPEIYVMDRLQTLDPNKIAWTKKNGSLGANEVVSNGILTINQNVLSEAKTATYQVVYNYAEGKSVSAELSFSLVKDGTEPADGKDAAVCSIIASGLSFTSTDGTTYLPESITLTPQFQGCGFDLWQYSINGLTWENVVSGQNGLTVDSNNTLTISNTTPLLSDTQKCLNIKLLSSQMNVVSVITITKLKDGQKGDKGEDAIVLQILSSAGNLFKNSTIATTLTVTIIVAGKMITSSSEMYEVFGKDASLQWEQKLYLEDEFKPLSSSDNRLSDNGFILTLTPQDVNTQTVFNCKLIY